MVAKLLSALSLAAPTHVAHGCIVTSGSASAPLPSHIDISMHDNGVEVCSSRSDGLGGGGDADNCVEGYRLSWTKPVVNGPQHVRYCLPTGYCHDEGIEESCDIGPCGNGDKNPCTSYDCTYSWTDHYDC